MMEKTGDQDRRAHSSSDDVQALQKELLLVREQADSNVQRLRDELVAVKAQLAACQHERDAAPVAEEAMRQEVTSLRESLAERQRELATADLTRQRVEDQLEDATREIERLRRLTSAKAEGHVLEKVRGVSPLLRPGKADVDPAEVIEDLLDTGLRDRRVKPYRRMLDMEKVTGKPRPYYLLYKLLIGLVLVFVGLEAVTYLSGHGEFFTFLFGK